MVKMPLTTPLTYYLVALLFPRKFPTLLAEREIIANASSLVRISPRTEGKGNKKFRNGKTISGFYSKIISNQSQ